MAKCTNCPTYTGDYVYWEQYKDGKKTGQIKLCKDCFASQAVYNAIKIFIQAPIKYNAILKVIYPYLLEDEDLTNEQKKKLKDFFKNKN
jgi:hypothetical protein